MQYRLDRQGEKISALGFGCMRFQRKNGGIDQQEAEREILRAVELGVNYFDTAYIYPGSEASLGEALQKYGLRGKVHIATKLPQYLIRSRQHIDRYFNEQLSRLKTDYVDYYLMHMLTDPAAWEHLVSLGIRDWIDEKKKSGQIRQIGFVIYQKLPYLQSMVPERRKYAHGIILFRDHLHQCQVLHLIGKRSKQIRIKKTFYHQSAASRQMFKDLCLVIKVRCLLAEEKQIVVDHLGIIHQAGEGIGKQGFLAEDLQHIQIEGQWFDPRLFLPVLHPFQSADDLLDRTGDGRLFRHICLQLVQKLSQLSVQRHFSDTCITVCHNCFSPYL